jgi:hypothetical protein
MLNYYEYAKRQEEIKKKRAESMAVKKYAQTHKKIIAELSENYKKRVNKFIITVICSTGR